MKRMLLIAGSVALALGLSGVASAQDEVMLGRTVLTWSVAERSGFILGAIDALGLYCPHPNILIRKGTLMTQAEWGMRERPQGAAWLEVWRAGLELGCLSETMQDRQPATKPAKRL
jgi:hypothetical protein